MITRLQLSLKSSVRAMMSATSFNGSLWKDSTSPSCILYTSARLRICTPYRMYREPLTFKAFVSASHNPVGSSTWAAG